MYVFGLHLDIKYCVNVNWILHTHTHIHRCSKMFTFIYCKCLPNRATENNNVKKLNRNKTSQNDYTHWIDNQSFWLGYLSLEIFFFLPKAKFKMQVNCSVKLTELENSISMLSYVRDLPFKKGCSFSLILFLSLSCFLRWSLESLFMTTGNDIWIDTWCFAVLHKCIYETLKKKKTFFDNDPLSMWQNVSSFYQEWVCVRENNTIHCKFINQWRRKTFSILNLLIIFFFEFWVMSGRHKQKNR